jgi:hypothetical protein
MTTRYGPAVKEEKAIAKYSYQISFPEMNAVFQSFIGVYGYPMRTQSPLVRGIATVYPRTNPRQNYIQEDEITERDGGIRTAVIETERMFVTDLFFILFTTDRSAH